MGEIFRRKLSGNQPHQSGDHHINPAEAVHRKVQAHAADTGKGDHQIFFAHKKQHQAQEKLRCHSAPQEQIPAGFAFAADEIGKNGCRHGHKYQKINQRIHP